MSVKLDSILISAVEQTALNYLDFHNKSSNILIRNIYARNIAKLCILINNNDILKNIHTLSNSPEHIMREHIESDNTMLNNQFININNADAIYAISLAYITIYKYNIAIDYLNKLYDNGYHCEYELGEIYDKLGRHNMAIHYYTKAVLMFDVRAYYKLGMLYLNISYQLSEKYLKLSILYNDIYALLGLIKLYVYNYKLELAEELIVSEQCQEHVDIYTMYEMAMLYKKVNNVNKMLEYLTICADNNFANANYDLGEYYECIDANKSMHFYEMFISINKHNVNILLKLLKMYQLNNNNNAIDRTLCMIYSTNKIIGNEQYVIYYMNNRLFDKAIQTLNALRDYRKTSYDYLFGFCYLQNNDIATALKYFVNGSIKGCYRSNNELGKICYFDKQYSKSIAYFNLCVDGADKFNNIGYAYYGARDYVNALHNFKIADEYGSLTSLRNIGVSYCALGEFDKAVQYFIKSVNSGDTDSHNNLEIVYNKIYRAPCEIANK